jgi:RimJ/RimL family protein N-acetyltransferase
MQKLPDVIETARLRILPFCEEFLTERYVGWLNDPETVAFSEQRHRSHTLATCRAYMHSFDGSPHYFRAVVRKEDGLHIGNINAYVDVPNRTVDVGILIGERVVWGNGFGLEAWSEFCNTLLAGGVRKITAGTMGCNTGMIRIFKKYGMQLEGVREKQFLCGGKDADLVMYAKFGR